MRKDSLIPRLLGIPPIQVSRELNCVLLGVDGQRRKAGRVPLVIGRVFELDAVDVGIGRKAVRRCINPESNGLCRDRPMPFSFSLRSSPVLGPAQ
jgi:hypothetical protein